MTKSEKKPLSEGISKLAEVIKKHEGWYAETGSEPNRPQRNNNPGNLSWSKFECGSETVTLKDGSEQRYAKFKDEKTGAKALNYQLEIIFAGKSDAYKPTDTIEEFVNKYAGNPPKEYIKAVAKAFDTTKDKTLKEAFEKNGYDLSGKGGRGGGRGKGRSSGGSGGGSSGSGSGRGSGGGLGSGSGG